MRILFSSHVFWPDVGGLETVSSLLAAEFASRGHQVRVVTQTPGTESGATGYTVYRRPSLWRCFELVRWCEVCFHNNISLPGAWPLLLLRRPWIVAHHVWIPSRGFAGRAKRLALRKAAGISISSAVAGHLDTPSQVIPNPYQDALFRPMGDGVRDRDLVFVGRLVSDKGVGVLLDALVTLRSSSLRPTVTIVGSGPEEAALRAQTVRLELERQVEFAGTRTGEDLARLLNRHRVLVVPSIWQEPFGIVALEGIACGCAVVASDGGGLPEAVGPCGLVFPVGDSEALARAIGQLLTDPARRDDLLRLSAAHLQKHGLAGVADQYLAVFAKRIADV